MLYQEAATDGCSIEEVVLKHFADLTKKLLRQDSFFLELGHFDKLHLQERPGLAGSGFSSFGIFLPEKLKRSILNKKFNY